MDPRRRQIRPDRVLNFPRPDFSRDQHTAYVYSYLNWPKQLYWTMGLSFNSYEERDVDVSDALYPKVGLQWNITDNLHVRMAYFETLRQAVLIEQTLEPTEIAGFNQFYNDPFGSQVKHYGIGIDGRFKDVLWSGIEIVRRDLTFPPGLLLSEAAPIIEEEVQEDLYRAYLYWTPLQSLALSAEYRFDRYELEEQKAAPPDRVILTRTTSVPLGLRYFHPDGFFAGLGATYVHQEVERSFTMLPNASGTEEFVTLDLAIGYRLPQRLGFVSVAISNLFDTEFRYQDNSFRTENSEPRDPQTPDLTSFSTFTPDRTIFAGVTLSF